MNRKIKTLFIFALFFVPGLALRLLSLEVPFFYHHDWDWAVFGNQAWDLLRGHWSAFRYAQSYLGTLPLFVDALNFAIFGPTRMALFLGSVYYWTLYTATLYFLTKQIYSRKTALAAAAMASISAASSMYLSVQPSRSYLDLMVMGNIMFICFLSIVKRDRTWKWIALGLVAGGAFWTSLLSAYYMTPVFVLLVLRTKKRFFGLNSFCAFLAFFAGSLPFWTYNLFNYRRFLTFEMMSGTGKVESYTHNSVCFAKKILFIFDIEFKAPFHAFFSFAVLCLLVAALVLPFAYLVRRARAENKGSLRDYGAGLLALFFMTAFLMNITSAKYGSNFALGIRYVMPLYTFFYIALARLCVAAGEKNRILFPLLAGLVLTAGATSQLETNDRLPWKKAERERKQAYARYLDDMRRMCRFFSRQSAHYVGTEHNNVDGIIASFDGIPFGLSFLEPIDRYTPEKSLRMDDQPESFRIDRSGRFESAARAMGFTFAKQRFGAYEAFCHVNKAFEEYRLLEARQYELKASAGGPAPARDGIINTRWLVFAPNSWLEIQRPGPEPVAKIILSNKTSFREIPCRLIVEGANAGDGQWSLIHDLLVCPGAVSYGNKIIERPAGAAVEINIPGDRAFERIRLRKPGGEPWSVNEIFVMTRAQTPAGARRGDRDAVCAALENEGPDMVYADEFTASRVLSATDIACFNEYEFSGRAHERRRPERKMDFSGRTALIVESAYADYTAGLLRETGLVFNVQSIGALRVFMVAPSGLPANLFWLGFAPSTYRHAETAALLARRALSAEREKDMAGAAACARRALMFDPENILALEILARNGKPEEKAALKKDLLAFRPATDRDIVLADYCRISGYTLARGDGKLRVKLFADTKSAMPAKCRPVLYCLGNNESVLAAFEPHPRLPVSCDCVWPSGTRLMLEGETKLPSCCFGLWLAFLDAEDKRVDIKSVDGRQPEKSNRCLLKKF